jgi:hypothetical protein
MYYAIEIGAFLFLSRSFRGFQIFLDVLDVDLSSLFIVEEPPYRI